MQFLAGHVSPPGFEFIEVGDTVRFDVVKVISGKWQAQRWFAPELVAHCRLRRCRVQYPPASVVCESQEALCLAVFFMTRPMVILRIWLPSRKTP